MSVRSVNYFAVRSGKAIKRSWTFAFDNFFSKVLLSSSLFWSFAAFLHIICSAIFFTFILSAAPFLTPCVQSCRFHTVDQLKAWHPKNQQHHFWGYELVLKETKSLNWMLFLSLLEASHNPFSNHVVQMCGLGLGS